MCSSQKKITTNMREKKFFKDFFLDLTEKFIDNFKVKDSIPVQNNL